MPRTNPWILSCVAALLFISTSSPSKAWGKDPKAKSLPVIFDTDIESDVDDVGSTALIHHLMDQGEANIIAMGVSAQFESCASCLDALNTFFGRPDIPIGVPKVAGAPARESKYTGPVTKEYPHDLPANPKEIADVVQVYRKALTEAEDGSVVMISVGYLTNFASLLKSEGDSISKLNGRELVAKKVKAWVCMGGAFPNGHEWNIKEDAPASIYAIEHWPTPIYFSGFEIGVKIFTGEGTKNCKIQPNPLTRSYELYTGGKHRESWDQTAVLYAIRGLNGKLDDVWSLSPPGTMTTAADGKNGWTEDPQGTHRYLIQKLPPEEVGKMIEKMMIQAVDDRSK